VAHKPVSPGDRVRKSASEYNAFLHAADWVEVHEWDRPGGTSKTPTSAFDRVRVQNFSQADRDQFDTIELGGLRILSSGGQVDGNLQVVFEALKPGHDNSGTPRTWPAIRTPRHTGVLTQPLHWSSSGGGSGSQVGWAAVSGIHPATIDVGNILHRRASVTSGCVLASDMTGPYEILNALSASGSQTCIVKKSNRASIKLLGVTGSGGISAATSASSQLTPGSASVEVLLWDEAASKYKLTGVSMTVYNVADAIAADKGISFSTDDDGVPTVDVEPCELEFTE